MVQFIYALMACASMHGPCWVLRGPYQTPADCRAQLEQVAQYFDVKIEGGVVHTENDDYVCMKRPASAWTPQ